MKNIKGSLILLITAFIWGTAFVAQTSAADSLGTFTFNAGRSFVAAAFLGILVLIRDCCGPRFKRSDSAGMRARSEAAERRNRASWPVQGGLLCGLMLFLAMSFQQAGIGAYPDGVAASGRAGFLTATYVVMVALCMQIRGRKTHPLVLVSIAGTICGMYLLCMSGGFSGIYVGDVLELCCAVCFTGHILVVDRYSDTDSFCLSCLQFLTAGVLSGVMCLFEHVNGAAVIRAIPLILYAGVLSSSIAYTLQLIGQKYAEPAVASIVMSLESVFAVIAGWAVLHEVLSTRELLGCAFVFAAVILAQVPQFLKT